MKKYNNGLETKNRIITEAAKLFYEYGYNKTSFTDICEAANVLPGTLNHHFGSYKNIATTIVVNQIENCLNRLHELLHKQVDNLTIATVAQCVHIFQFFKDEKYRKFFTEYDIDHSGHATIENYFSSYEELVIKPLEREYQLRHSGDETTIDFLYFFHAFSAIDGPIEVFLCDHLDDFTPEKAIHYYYRIFYSFFEFEKKELDSLIEHAINIYYQLNIKSSYFDLEINFADK